MTAPTLQPEGLPPVEPPIAIGTGGGRRFRGIRRTLAPILAARGLARWLLWSGVAIVLLFVICAVFASVVAPYHFDTFESGGVRFPKYGHPSMHHLFGTSVRQEDVFSRVVYGARTALQEL